MTALRATSKLGRALSCLAVEPGRPLPVAVVPRSMSIDQPRVAAAMAGLLGYNVVDVDTTSLATMVRDGKGAEVSLQIAERASHHDRDVLFVVDLDVFERDDEAESHVLDVVARLAQSEWSTSGTGGLLVIATFEHEVAKRIGETIDRDDWMSFVAS